MQKKYVVRLTDEERGELEQVVRKLKGTSQKVRRAQVLLKSDADGPNWSDHRIAEAFGCRVQTVEKIRQRLVERGFRETLDGAKRDKPPGARALVRRIEFHPTPKHGSWLNIAENELRSWTRQ